MTNTNNSAPRARVIPKDGRALYEFATLEDGTIVIKSVIVPREVKDEMVSKPRVTE